MIQAVLLRRMPVRRKFDLVESPRTHDLGSRRLGTPANSRCWFNNSDIAARPYARCLGTAPHRRIFRGMAGQKNDAAKRTPASTHAAGVQRKSFLRPGLAIPCRVASPQSPTPFHQAMNHTPTFAASFKTDTSALRVGKFKTVISAYRHRDRRPAELPPRKIRTVDIIVRQTHPQSRPCRF